jgi:peptide/nickel transport system substrate-binding protein
MNRSSPVSALLALLVPLAIAGCDGGTDGPGPRADVPEAERYGGTVVIGTFGDLQPMNRFVSSDYNTNMIQREMLFMPLVKFDERIEPVPWLAERWDTVRVAPDSLELTFQLREDIRWHDGEPTTAHDVAFTYQRLQDPATGFPNPAYFEYYHPDAEVLDDRTIRFRLRAHAEFLEPWYLTPSMPRHLLESAAPSEMMNHPFGTREPVGNGPFRFVRRVPGQEWVFEANADFPDALGGRPYLDRVVWRYIPSRPRCSQRRSRAASTSTWARTRSTPRGSTRRATWNCTASPSGSGSTSPGTRGCRSSATRACVAH